MNIKRLTERIILIEIILLRAASSCPRAFNYCQLCLQTKKTSSSKIMTSIWYHTVTPLQQVPTTPIISNIIEGNQSDRIENFRIDRCSALDDGAFFLHFV